MFARCATGFLTAARVTPAPADFWAVTNLPRPVVGTLGPEPHEPGPTALIRISEGVLGSFWVLAAVWGLRWLLLLGEGGRTSLRRSGNGVGQC